MLYFDFHSQYVLYLDTVWPTTPYTIKDFIKSGDNMTN